MTTLPAELTTIIMRYSLRVLLCLSAAAMACAQSSLPPLPNLPLTLAFSNCEAGVIFRATIIDWVRDANGNVSPIANSKVVTGSTVSFSYLFYGSFTLTAGGVTQTASGVRLPDGSTSRPLGAFSILYTNLGIQGVPAATQIQLQSSNASGLGLGTGQATAGLAWTASIYGLGDLMPNGLLSPLPPIASLSAANTFIQGDGRFLARPVSSYGNCELAELAKMLGEYLGLTGSCQCGDPIDIATGNLFERIEDYSTAGQNHLAFTRFYNSLAVSSTFATSLGPNWRHAYDRYLRIGSTSVTAERDDGRQLTFTLSNGVWTPDTDIDLKLTNSGSTWTLTGADDSIETYRAISSTQALLQSIRRRNGFTYNLQYDASNQLTSVTDSFNRQLRFTYTAGRLQTLATPDNLTFTYSFNSGRLTSIGFSTTPPTTQQYLYENSAFPNALTGVIDENGNRYLTWTYDSRGRATSSQRGDGADLTRVAYNDTDNTRTVTNPLGSQLVYRFTTLQKALKVTQIDRPATPTTAAATRRFTYDANGYTASETDWNGNLTSFVNDSRGRPTSITAAAGSPQSRTTTVTYHATLKLPARIVQPGLTTTFTYDSNGNLLTRTLTDTTTNTVPYSTAGAARTWTYTWTNFQLASVKSPRTDVAATTQITYASDGALTASVNPLGHAARVTRHLPGGLPQTIVDPNGVATDLAYDARLRLISRAANTAARPLTTTYRYDDAGNLIAVADPTGAMSTSEYDTARRLIATADALGQRTEYSLDALGNRTQVNVLDASAQSVRATTAAFDSLGLRLREPGAGGRLTSYSYDNNGNVVAVTDALNRVTRRGFDPFNHLIQVTDAAGGVTSTVYNAQGHPSRVTAPNGAVTTYVYNGFGDLIQQSSPDSGTVVYRYDAAGNVTQRTDATGAVTNFTYDALDRITSVSYPAAASDNVTYRYDEPGSAFGVGRLTSLTDPAGSLKRSFDDRGNIIAETRTTGELTRRTAYAYDDANRITSITYPSGWTVSYTRDALGRTTSIAAQSADGNLALPVISEASYQPFGPVAGFTYGNGILHLRTFDADQRVTSIRDVQTLDYSYDAAGNVAGIAGGGNAAASQALGYDALDRLTQASGIYGILEFTYDPNGNRLSRTRDGAVTNYTYTPQTNQLAAIATADMKQTFTNDKNGAIARIDSDNGDTVQFTHNASGRLAAVSSSAGSIAQYTYDAFGRRLARVGAMTATTLFQYDVIGANLLEEAAGDGSARVDYIYLDSLPVAALNPATGELSYLHTDRLGTPQSATSAGQSIVWSAAAGPFGELDTVPSLIVQNLRFPGQEFDAETGLHQNGFRDYAPQLGRYIQSDPIGLVAGVNTYAYATANPLRFTDPRGLQGIPIPYDASYYQAALASAIYCRRNPAACAAVEKQARQARADELNTVASFLEILGGLALLDPLTAPATPLLGYGALCLKTQAQLVNPDPTQVAGDLVTKAVTSGAGKPAQPILEFILQQFFSTRPAY